ncbi:hypothetical protein JCM30237_23550 [Halolamina litorea]|uniref:Phosphotransferase family protein n=1 Tax=Halolamina litorea TaxID=1515593 RepID=A0ABD6BTU2_9EURY|nr:phosphotransferase [Halolamina litorea]
MFTHTAIRDALQAVNEHESAVATILAVDAGTNHSYRITFEDGSRRLLKVGTRFPDAFPAEPKTMAVLGERTDIPVPQVYGMGESPLGYPFAVYEFVPSADADDGRVSDLPPAAAEQLCREAGENLGALHRETLPAFGPVGVDGDGFVVTDEMPFREMLRGSLDRQLSLLRETPFSGRCEALGELSEELIERIDSEALRPALAHGDYRLENLAVDPTAEQVTSAVLDWERPTATDPLWDAVMAKALLTAGYGLDEEFRRSLEATFWDAYGDGASGTARRACYELLARVRLARHLDEEVGGESATAVSARVREHERAFDRLLA